jgi:hypothetical protein
MSANRDRNSLDLWHAQFVGPRRSPTEPDFFDTFGEIEIGGEGAADADVGGEPLVSEPWIAEEAIRRPSIEDFAVLVDQTGEIVARKKEGSAVNDVLAGRDGRWRVVTPSGSLIILGRVDADGDSPQVPLAGEIEAAGGVANVLAFLNQNRWSGRFHTIEAASYRSINFVRGDVTSCESNIPCDRLGELLFRFGRISREDLDQALTEVGPDRRIGQVLVDLGLATSHDVFTVIRKQIEEVFFAILRLRKGSYCFERTYADDSMNLVSVSTQSLLLEGARRADEMAYFREKIPSSDVVCAARRSPPPDTKDMSAELSLVLSLVDGSRTVHEIARVARLGEFDATRALYELMNAGWIEIKRDNLLGCGPLEAVSGDRSASRLIEVFNDFLATINGILTSAHKQDQLRIDLKAFVEGGTTFAPLFKGLEPAEDGRLAGPLILANLAQIETPKPEEYLQQGLSELLCFLFFVAGDAIGRHRQKELTELLQAALKRHDQSAA